MQKTIFITGSTDGIGLETAKQLVQSGHHILLHGRNPEKLATAEATVRALANNAKVESYLADLSRMSEVETLVKTIAGQHEKLDVLINNAGVYTSSEPMTADGLDVRFAVNSIAPYLLTKRLLPLLGPAGRVINLSSAAQSPVDIDALLGRRQLAEGAAYAQSKLALTIWSRHLAQSPVADRLVLVAVNPGSFLGTKMVKEAYGSAGKDIGIGVDILFRAALSDEFAGASGQYYDNDMGQFGTPHPDALNPAKGDEIVAAIESILERTTIKP